MLIWLVLIPLIAAALIGLCKAPARPTALLSASPDAGPRHLGPG